MQKLRNQMDVNTTTGEVTLNQFMSYEACDLFENSNGQMNWDLIEKCKEMGISTKEAHELFENEELLEAGLNGKLFFINNEFIVKEKEAVKVEEVEVKFNKNVPTELEGEVIKVVAKAGKKSATAKFWSKNEMKRVYINFADGSNTFLSI